MLASLLAKSMRAVTRAAETLKHTHHSRHLMALQEMLRKVQEQLEVARWHRIRHEERCRSGAGHQVLRPSCLTCRCQICRTLCGGSALSQRCGFAQYTWRCGSLFCSDPARSRLQQHALSLFSCMCVPGQRLHTGRHNCSAHLFAGAGLSHPVPCERHEPLKVHHEQRRECCLLQPKAVDDAFACLRTATLDLACPMMLFLCYAAGIAAAGSDSLCPRQGRNLP